MKCAWVISSVPLSLFLWAGLMNPSIAPAQNAHSFHINSQRLQGTREKLSEFGRNSDGGVTRLGYSDTELAAREYVVGLMKDAGLEVHTDAGGNLFGKRAGSENLPTLLFGPASTPSCTLEILMET